MQVTFRNREMFGSDQKWWSKCFVRLDLEI